MMTLIDSSAWIEFFRAKGHPAFKAQVADLISLKAAAYTCPVKYELVLGARKQELPDLMRGLGFASRIEVSPSHWDMASSLGSDLRLKGLNFPALDLLIATVASEGNFSLLARDAHFTGIRDHVLPGLRLFPMP